jgi:hypothetical protein
VEHYVADKCNTVGSRITSIVIYQRNKKTTKNRYISLMNGMTPLHNRRKIIRNDTAVKYCREILWFKHCVTTMKFVKMISSQKASPKADFELIVVDAVL